STPTGALPNFTWANMVCPDFYHSATNLCGSSAAFTYLSTWRLVPRYRFTTGARYAIEEFGAVKRNRGPMSCVFCCGKCAPEKGTSRLTQRYLVSTDMESLVMTNLRGQEIMAMNEVLASNDVRTLIAEQLGVDVKRVTDEAHFTDDLGADWLDRLELMIVI